MSNIKLYEEAEGQLSDLRQTIHNLSDKGGPTGLARARNLLEAVDESLRLAYEEERKQEEDPVRRMSRGEPLTAVQRAALSIPD